MLFDEHYFRRSIADLEARPDSLFASDLEYEMEHRFRFPIEQTGTLLTRFETRGSAAAERFALYLGPLVGVLLGAGLTLLLHDSQPGGPSNHVTTTVPAVRQPAPRSGTTTSTTLRNPQKRPVLSSSTEARIP